MKDVSSYKNTVDTLNRFINEHCFNYVMYMANESQPTNVDDFGEQIYAYLSRHAEVRMRNTKSQGNRLMWRLFYNMIEEVPEFAWTTLASYYLEVYKQTEEPESGNWFAPNPLQD